MAELKIAGRYDWLDILNTGTSGAPIWSMMGEGFTSLDENPGAQVESKIYIHQRSATVTTKSYETVFPFSADAIVSEEAVKYIYDIARNHKTGADAVTDYIRIELWDEVGTDTKIFRARKFRVAVAVDSVSGAGGETGVISGNLNAQGDPIDGVWDFAAKEFSPTEE